VCVFFTVRVDLIMILDLHYNIFAFWFLQITDISAKLMYN